MPLQALTLWRVFVQAYLALADYVECETDIKRALAEDPKNVGVRLLQKEYKQKVGLGNPAACGGCCSASHISNICRPVQLPQRKPAV